MKKVMMALALIASMVVCASIDVYSFKSSMKVYSLKSQKYVSTSFNGTMTVDTDTGDVVINATKKDTKEVFELALDGGSTNAADNAIFAIVTGKKNTVAASYWSQFVDEDGRLSMSIAGNGTAKTVVTGCGPCGDTSSCTKIKTIKGSFIGAYDCGCSNGQHFVYDGSCELPEEKETATCPVHGTWTATLKTVDGAKYK